MGAALGGIHGHLGQAVVRFARVARIGGVELIEIAQGGFRAPLRIGFVLVSASVHGPRNRFDRGSLAPRHGAAACLPPRRKGRLQPPPTRLASAPFGRGAPGGLPPRRKGRPQPPPTPLASATVGRAATRASRVESCSKSRTRRVKPISTSPVRTNTRLDEAMMWVPALLITLVTSFCKPLRS